MSKSLKYSLLFAALGALFYLPFLGGVHLFDWDEINFAEISREMLITEEYFRVYVNFLPFWEKPPFFFWMQAGAMKLFGVGEYAARFPNALCGIITLVLLFNIGKRLYDTRFGIIWAGVYFGSVLPFLYFKSGIIDPFFNLYIFLGLYLFILGYWKKEGLAGIRLRRSHWIYLFWAGFFVGMGILTKGQVAYLIVALTLFVYWISQRLRFFVSVPQFLFFTLAATLVTLFWYGLETAKNGPWFINEFNKYQYRLFSTPDAGHRGFPGYHFVVLLVGVFPASVFALRAFAKLPTADHLFQADMRRWMKYLFWVVLILFTIVKSKIVHYSSMCYFPLTYLAALVIYHLSREEISFARWMKISLGVLGGIYVLATLALPIVGRQAEVLAPLFDDPFARGNLQADVSWPLVTLLPGLFYLAVLIAFFLWSSRGQWKRALLGLFGGTAVFVFLALIFFIGRIEGYSQRAAVEFFEEKVGPDSYVTVHGYKSYAHLFYGRRPMIDNPEEVYNNEYLLHGPVDKDVYIVTKVHKADELRALPELEEIGEKNGFVFFKRAARK